MSLDARRSGKTGGAYDASQFAVGRIEGRQMDGYEKEGETSLNGLAEVTLAYYQETELPNYHTQRVQSLREYGDFLPPHRRKLRLPRKPTSSIH